MSWQGVKSTVLYFKKEILSFKENPSVFFIHQHTSKHIDTYSSETWTDAKQVKLSSRLSGKLQSCLLWHCWIVCVCRCVCRRDGSWAKCLLAGEPVVDRWCLGEKLNCVQAHPRKPLMLTQTGLLYAHSLAHIRSQPLLVHTWSSNTQQGLCVDYNLFNSWCSQQLHSTSRWDTPRRKGNMWLLNRREGKIHDNHLLSVCKIQKRMPAPLIKTGHSCNHQHNEWIHHLLVQETAATPHWKHLTQAIAFICTFGRKIFVNILWWKVIYILIICNRMCSLPCRLFISSHSGV